MTAGVSRTLKILHVMAPAPVGGLERVVSALARGHRARNHDVAVAALLQDATHEPSVLAELRAGGVTVFPIVLPSRAYLRQWRRLRDLTRMVGPTIIHSHGYLPDFLVALDNRRNMSAATVTTVHGFTGGDLKNRAYEWLQMRTHRSFDGVVAVSNSIKSRLVASGVSESHVHVVRNAWSPDMAFASRTDARRALGVAEDALTIGWIGRISHEKGLDVLVEALPALSDLGVRVVVLGDGSARAACQRIAESRGVSDQLFFRGVVPNAGHWVRAFDVIVLSSRTEGTPITLLDAVRAEVPVVSSAVGGIPEVVGPEEALLVPAEHPQQLATAIRDSLENVTASAERARRARHRLDRDLSPGPWFEAYERIYRQLSNGLNA